MYSRILFMVETSFSGFLGSGPTHTSAVDRIASTSASGMRPVNSTTSSRPSSCVSATRSSYESPEPINVNDTSRAGHAGRAQQVVDAVLGCHDAQVGDEEGPAALERRVGRQARKAPLLGAGAHDHDLLGVEPAAAQGHVAVGLVGRDHEVGRGVGETLERAQPVVPEALAPEARDVDLGRQVVLVEQEALAEQL